MCFKERKSAARILAICSIIAVIFGILMIAFSAMFTNSSVLEAIGKEDETLDDARKFIFMVLLIFSLATLSVAALGLVLVCVKNRCITCTYGIILFPTWLAVIIIGAVATLAASAADKALDDTCESFSDALNTDDFSNFLTSNDLTSSSSDRYGSSTLGYSFDIYDTSGLNQYMCSANCPCDPTHAAKWNDVQRPGGLVFNGAYTTYSACLNADTHFDPEFTTWAQAVRSQTEYLDWMKWFEDEFDCGGICVKARFYWSKDLSAGPPSKACLKGMHDGLTSAFTGLSVCTLLAGIFLFFMFIWQYCLWKKYD